MNYLILIVFGTRPEIIKFAPIINILKEEEIPFKILSTGQHWDEMLTTTFLKDFDIKPDFRFNPTRDSLGVRLGDMISSIDRVIKTAEIKFVLVEGDTDSVLAGGLAANKAGVLLGHVEAGLRSYDLRMPEEHNRRLVDHISNYLFAPTNTAARTLNDENVWGEVHVVGNTAIDAVEYFMPYAQEHATILESIGTGDFILTTVHRAENVDDEQILADFIGAFCEAPLPVVLPIHPRTEQRLKDFGMLETAEIADNLLIIPPVNYLDFLALMNMCKFIATDSGGICEEATAPSIRKKVLILRIKTDRPEAIEAGYATLVGVKKDKILKAMRLELSFPYVSGRPSPYGSGNAGRKIVDVIKEVLRE